MSQPLSSNDPFTFTIKMGKPRDFLKAEPYICPFSKEGIERHNQKMKQEAEDKRKFVESLDMVFAKFEEQKKEVCIISLSELNLGEEVQDDDIDDDVEEDTDNLQEELLEEVSELPTDGVTKQTEELIRKALQSVDIKCISKLTPAS